MKNRFKLAFVALLIATIAWGILFYLILQEYREFVEGLSQLQRMWGYWTPWWRWNGMPWVIVAGICLLVAWVLLINEAIHARARGENQKV
jgi:ABC-type branched-subunit amino acid transport system permease subunit